MRVLRVIDSMDPTLGGPGQGIRNTIPALEKIGVTCEVVALDAPDAPFLKTDPFVTHAVGPSSSPWHYSAKLIPWMLDNLSRFDAVIVEGLWLYYSHAAAKAVRLFKARNKSARLHLFVMPHGMLDPYFQRAPERRLKAVRNWMYWKLLESGVVNDADGMLFTCEEELKLARQTFTPYHPKREFNIGFGIPRPPALMPGMVEAFYEKCPAVTNRQFILYLSRIHEKKGVDLLVEGYARTANETTPDLVIAGPGLDTAYGQRIVNLVKEHNLGSKVHFPGMLSGPSKWGAIYASEAFALISHQENFGIAVVEALACGKPVLISRQINIWREIIEAKAGIACTDNAREAEQILRSWYAMDPVARGKMSSHAVAAFETFFDVHPVAKRMLNTFNQFST